MEILKISNPHTVIGTRTKVNVKSMSVSKKFETIGNTFVDRFLKKLSAENWFRPILSKKILPIFWNVLPIFGDFFFAQNRPKGKFYYAMWVLGTNFMKYFFPIYVSKIGAYEANSPLQKRFCDFSQRGYVFGFYWH